MAKGAIACGEALAEGAVMIPNLILGSVIYHHYGDFAFLFPFVLLYSFEKAGVFALRGFGHLHHPYRVLEGGLVLAILGTVLCLFSRFDVLFLSLGAIFMGLGLANFTAIFRTIRDLKQGSGEWPSGKVLLWGYFILLAFMLFIGVYEIWLEGAFEVVFLAFLGLEIPIYLQVRQFRKTAKMEGEPCFIYEEGSWVNFLSTFGILGMTLFIRLLKQTSEAPFLYFAAMIFCVFLLLQYLFHHELPQDYAWDTVWFGAVRNFLVIFSLIYFIAIGRRGMVTFSYMMVALGVVLALVIRGRIRGFLSPMAYQRLCFLGCLGSLGLLFSPHLYGLGILLSTAFVSMGNSLALQKFVGDEGLPRLERRMIRAKFYSFGAIVQQLTLLTVLILVSGLLYEDAFMPLRAYAFFKGTVDFEQVFFYTKGICIGLIWLTGLALLGGKRRGKIA